MVLPFTINSAQDWLLTVPSFLLNAEKASELVMNEEEVQEYLASTLIDYFYDAQDSLTNSIVSILESDSDSGKYLLIKILLRSPVIWHDVVKNERLRAALTALALSPDKNFTKDAVQLSKNLEDLTSTSTRKELSFIEDSRSEMKSSIAFSEPQLPAERISDVIEHEDEERELIGKGTILSTVRSPPKPVSIQPSLPGAPPPSPPPPSAGLAGDAPEAAQVVEDEIGEAEDEMEETFEEPLAFDDSFEVEKEVKKKKKRSFSPKKPQRTAPPQPVSDPERIFTHIHYFNRMNSRKTYEFTVSLSKVAKKVRKRTMNILTGERQTEKQAEFELDELTRQIMVELLISGCLVQPTFQYVDPEKLPAELIFYITPLVEAGYQSSKVDGQLLLKDDVGLVLQGLPLSDIYVVSTRISKLAALIGTLAGAAVPILDFFGWGIQDALTGQLTNSLPGLASSFDIRSLITTSQIVIFVIFISLALIWWQWKGRSRRAPEERLSLNLP